MHLSVVAAETPHKTAVVFGDTRISYGALDAASRRIAVSSRHSGLSRGDVMGVMMSRSSVNTHKEIKLEFY